MLSPRGKSQNFARAETSGGKFFWGFFLKGLELLVHPIVPKMKHTDLKECFDKKKFQKTNTNFFFKASFFKLFFIFHPILLRKTKKKGNFCIFFFFGKNMGEVSV
jgi:hypothetical protein